MAQRCEICGKGRVIGHNVSYSKRRTRRIFKPNLRWANIKINSEVKKVKICMKCLKKAKNENRVVSRMQKVERVPRKSEVPRVEKEATDRTEKQKAESTKVEKSKNKTARKGRAII